MGGSLPPERLTHDLVVLVRATPSHLMGLHAAIESSHAELYPWMDWVDRSPQPLDVTRSFLEARADAWRTREEFAYAMTDPVSAEVIGMCSLMARAGPGRLEIGYWVRTDRTGAGIATAAADLLTDAGLAVHAIDIVEIHHDEANTASGRIPEKLGYLEVSRRAVGIDPRNPGESGVEVIWELMRSERS